MGTLWIDVSVPKDFVSELVEAKGIQYNTFDKSYRYNIEDNDIILVDVCSWQGRNTGTFMYRDYRYCEHIADQITFVNTEGSAWYSETCLNTPEGEYSIICRDDIVDLLDILEDRLGGKLPASQDAFMELYKLEQMAQARRYSNL